MLTCLIDTNFNLRPTLVAPSVITHNVIPFKTIYSHIFKQSLPSSTLHCAHTARLLLIKIILYSYSNIVLSKTESLSSSLSIATTPSRRKTNCPQTQSLRSDAPKAYFYSMRLCLILSSEYSLHFFNLASSL